MMLPVVLQAGRAAVGRLAFDPLGLGQPERATSVSAAPTCAPGLCGKAAGWTRRACEFFQEILQAFRAGRLGWMIASPFQAGNCVVPIIENTARECELTGAGEMCCRISCMPPVRSHCPASH